MNTSHSLLVFDGVGSAVVNSGIVADGIEPAVAKQANDAIGDGLHDTRNNWDLNMIAAGEPTDVTNCMSKNIIQPDDAGNIKIAPRIAVDYPTSLVGPVFIRITVFGIIPGTDVPPGVL